MHTNNKNQSIRLRSGGQALVLVLLALAVVLTIVLFVLSRSITDISISSSESQAVSAFSAAEAGVEQALVIGTGGASSVGTATYTSAVSNFGQGTTSFVYPLALNSGDSMTLWLKAQDATSSNFTGSTIKVCWGKPGTYPDKQVVPAIEFTLFYQTTANDPATVKIYRATGDPISALGSARTVTNNFSAASGNCTSTISGQTFQFQSTFSIPPATYPNPQFAFIRMFYNTDTAQPVAFDSTDSHLFPSQGILVDSTGEAGESSRKVEVFQGWPEIPLPFQFSVYSTAGVEK